MEERVKIITPGTCDYFRKVLIPASLGDDTGEAAPKNGNYRNAIVAYAANGAVYIYSSDGIYTKMPGSVGPKGSKGDKGDTGSQGPAGPANVLSIGTVETGTHSSASITGTSPNQVLNLTLQKGDKGDTGNGIASATLNADYTLTLTFTNGTSYTTPSIRGEQGEQGPQGPAGSYTAGTGIDITNGVISKVKYDLIEFIENQGIDTTITSSSPPLTPTVITEQQYDVITEFILAHKNDGTLYVDYQYVHEGVTIYSWSVSPMCIAQHSATFTEDKGFGIGNVEFLTFGYLFNMLYSGAGVVSIVLCHNTDTGIYYFLHVISG